MNKKTFSILVAGALLFKLVLFTVMVLRAPESKYAPDTGAYIELAGNLYEHKAFAIHNPDGSLEHNIYRTPGYPFFLALFHFFLRIPFTGIVLIQILLTLAAAWATYKIAMEIEPQIAPLAALIMLYDFPTTIVSLRILTEPLYLALISFFFLYFIRYLKKGNAKQLFFPALFLVVATYVRPVSYYLGVVTAVFILYAVHEKSFKMKLLHVIGFCWTVHKFLGLWQIRNYAHYGQTVFSAAARDNFKWQGLLAVCTKESHSFLTAAFQCTVGVGDGFIRFMTKPGLLKYYHSDFLLIAGKIAVIPILIFQLTGFFVGCFNIRENKKYQFLFLVFLYFAVATIFNVFGSVGERYRIPVMPCIAVLSAFGWQKLSKDFFRNRNLKSAHR